MATSSSYAGPDLPRAIPLDNVVRARATGVNAALAIAVAIAAITAGTHLAAPAFPPGLGWGVNAFAFLPQSFALCCGGALALVLLLAAWSAVRPVAPAAPLAPPLLVRPQLALAAVGVLAGTLFWCARARHLFLGDGFAIVDGPTDWSLHPLEPLAAWLVRLFISVGSPLFAAAGVPESRVAWQAAALGSCVAGALFVPLAWGIAKELVPAESRDAEGTPVALLALVLLAQGYIQIFFGYVETYAWSTLGLGLYLWTALRFLNRRGSLRAAGMALALALVLHLSAAALLPAHAVLIAVGLRDPERRRALARDLGFTAAAFGAVVLACAAAGGGYFLPATLWNTVVGLLRGDHTWYPQYFASWMHARDFLNEQALIGPLGALLFLPAAWLRLHRDGGSPRTWFLLACGAGWLAACLVAGDSNLGYARNWDLLAPASFVLTVAGLGLLFPDARAAAIGRVALGVMLALSLFHTAPWVTLNASLPRSLARFESLPLGLGRVESTLGYWSAREGDTKQAEIWYARSLDANPGNVRAHFHLGEIYLDDGRYGLAASAFRAALGLRPDDDGCRLRLAEALRRNGDLDGARRELRVLVERQPGSPRVWLAYGLVLMDSGRIGEARWALENSIRLDGGSGAADQARATEARARLAETSTNASTARPMPPSSTSR